MPKLIQIATTEFPGFDNLEVGQTIEFSGQARVADVKQASQDATMVTLSLSTFNVKPDVMGRFDKLTRILEKAVAKDGRLKVTTQTQHLGQI